MYLSFNFINMYLPLNIIVNTHLPFTLSLTLKSHCHHRLILVIHHTNNTNNFIIDTHLP